MPRSPRRLFCGARDFRLRRVLRALTLGISLLPAGVAQADPIVALQQQEAGVSAVVAANPSAWPELITVHARFQNMQPSRAVPFTVELPPGATSLLCTFAPVERKRPSRTTYRWSSQIGSLQAPDRGGGGDKRGLVDGRAAVYTLPYPEGVTHEVTQAHCGAVSHTGRLRYAVDWSMPEGSPVCAARAGRVVRVVAGFDRGGRAREMQEFSNLLMIQHADGTLGEYLHLQKNGVLVKVGDEVQAGDLVARSGNTGCSTGPHLHFHVRQPLDGSTWRSVPVRFQTTAGQTEVLTKGVSYTATRGAESMRQAEESRPPKGSPTPPERS